MPRPTALPLHVQISEMLIRDIQSGRLMEGERLPPERDMAADLGISVGTLRRALAGLTEKGLLNRVQGSGNYIRNDPQPQGIYAFFRLETIGGGGLPTARVVALDRLAKPDHLPLFGTSAMAHRIRRVRSLGERAAALEEIWLDAGYASDLRIGDLSESLYYHYANRLGLRIQRAEDRVGTGIMPDWSDEPVLPAGKVCGHVERISWDQNGQRAEVSFTWFDSETTRYVARLR